MGLEFAHLGGWAAGRMTHQILTAQRCTVTAILAATLAAFAWS